MKYFIIFLLILVSACKSEKNKYVIKKGDGYDLPAAQMEKSVERSLIYSVQDTTEKYSFKKVIFNGKEYSPKEFSPILKTLDTNSYLFESKIDSVDNWTILVITKKYIR